MKNLALPLAVLTVIAGQPLARADEGQWQPHQLPQLKGELKRIGIAIPAEKLSDLARHPMSAVVALPGCTGAFVSGDGLVLTNHHCAFGAIARNATPARNTIANGYLATDRAAELPGGPGTLVYVTEQVENVSARVLKDLDPAMPGRARNDEIKRRIKVLIAECETDKAYRCTVPAFHRGLEYYRIRQLMIRDVRVVYAPSDKVGRYGGDIDNYEWPRHTGDFSFLRAYVGKDGRPADPSPSNVPYKSKDFLTVSAEGVKNGDPVVLAGYPGRTSRYKLAAEARHAEREGLPRRAAGLRADLAVIAAATAGDQARALRYARTVQSQSNVLKKSQGLLDGFARSDIAAIKDAHEAQMRAWLGQDAEAQAMLAEMDAAVQADMQLQEQEFAFMTGTASQLLQAARTLYKLALENQKPDAEREPGYQQRDLMAIRARLAALDQTVQAAVDEARFGAALGRYAGLPAAIRPQGLDALLPTPETAGPMLRATRLGDHAARMAWIGRTPEEFARSDDPLIALVPKLQGVVHALEEQRKEVDGRLEQIIPRYMAAVVAWKKSQGKPVYPDGNGTLRVSYGTVAPYAPQDGVLKGSFTTVEGIVAKHTGADPFNAPDALRDAVRQRRYGDYKDAALGSVPVNFLSSLDTTSGNSGSPVLNRRGELVGLNFDSTYESLTKDWYYDAAITRAIHVDVRYMLWVMQHVDKAVGVLAEMNVRGSARK